jgi:RHS repeat-associated protein
MGTVAAQGSFRFQSDLTDALTGQVDMLTRMYEPTLGRFSVRDPLMGTPTEPVSLNQYVYGQMNPVSLSDPTGLRPECGDCTRAAEQKGIDEWASHSAEHPVPIPPAMDLVPPRVRSGPRAVKTGVEAPVVLISCLSTALDSYEVGGRQIVSLPFGCRLTTESTSLSGLTARPSCVVSAGPVGDVVTTTVPCQAGDGLVPMTGSYEKKRGQMESGWFENLDMHPTYPRGGNPCLSHPRVCVAVAVIVVSIYVAGTVACYAQGCNPEEPPHSLREDHTGIP